MEKKNVKVYSTTTCPWCNVAKEFLRKNEVEFEDLNVAENTEAAKEMVEKSGQSDVPVIDVDGTVIVGFNEGAIKQALGIN